jgi:hypothetical protein
MVDTGEAAGLARLQEIFERAEFQTPPSFWERLADVLWRWLREWWPRPGGGRQDGSLATWELALAIAVSLVVVVALAAFGYRSARAALTGEARLRAVSGEARERSDRLWQEGQHLAAVGRLAEACRALYLSALYALDERGVMRLEAAATNLEHARRLAAAQPELAEPFERLVQRYDRLRYGRYPVDRPAYDEVRALVERTRAARGLRPAGQGQGPAGRAGAPG